MRSYDPQDADDVKTAQDTRAEPWMLECIAMNPAYVHWGPYEDYMCSKDEGWGGRVIVDDWKAFGPWSLDDLNECANFYFYVERDSINCEACGQSGLNPASHAVAEDFYDFARTGRRWVDNITQDEADALVAEGRLTDFTRNGIARPTAEQVNAWSRGGGFGHDAINRWILVETRCKRLGVWGECSACGGSGSIYTSETARLGLVLWMLHPRKGASRGVDVKNITRETLPQAIGWLRDAGKRNAERFGKLPG